MDSKSQQFIRVLRESTGYDATFFFLGREFSEVVKEMRTLLFPELQNVSDYSIVRQTILKAFGPQVEKINDESQRQLFSIISSA
jgi:hypothetical protein